MSGLEIKHQRNFHVIRWTLALLLFALVGSYAYFGVRWYNTGELAPVPMPVAAADTSIDETPISDKQIQSYATAPGDPKYLEFSKLNIAQARIVKLGVDSRNLLDVPKKLDDAGWYTKSSTPGSDAGAILINGHSIGANRSGIFAKLETAAPGDQIAIERGDGKVFTYEVVDVRNKSFSWVNSVGMKEMMRSVDPSKEGLNLMTSSGKWIPKDETFDRRVLVRATIIE